MARGAGGLLQPQPWGRVPGAVGRVGTRSPIPIRGHAFWVPWVGLGPHPRRERARPAWRQRSLPGHVEKARGAAGARPPGSPSLIPLNFTPPPGHSAHRGLSHQARVAGGAAGHVAVALAAEGRAGAAQPRGPSVFALLLSSAPGAVTVCVTPLRAAAHVVLCMQRSRYKVSPAATFKFCTFPVPCKDPAIFFNFLIGSAHGLWSV